MTKMKLECFPTVSNPPELVGGRHKRDWMDNFQNKHPYRCLPMTIAHTTGWELLLPFGFTAVWNGGNSKEDISIVFDEPDTQGLVHSHFSHGVLTFHPGYLFRTPKDWSLLVSGPPNHIKDGIQPFTALVETDWLPFPFTMNWVFTRPGEVRFEKGEPFCFITLMQDKKVEEFEPVLGVFQNNPGLLGQYENWSRQRGEFNTRLAQREPIAIQDGWQRNYYKGEPPADTCPVPDNHTNKRRLKGLNCPEAI